MTISETMANDDNIKSRNATPTNLEWDVRSFIQGRRVDSAASEILQAFNPATGQPLYRLPVGSPQDTKKAVDSAVAAVASRAWIDMPLMERKRVLGRFGDLVEGNAAELAQRDALEMGLPVTVGAASITGWARETIRFCAEAIDKHFTEFVPCTGGIAYSAAHPCGVIGVIVPWNFPAAVNILRALPALAAGNSIIVKPSEIASASAVRVAELALEAGVPPGVYNVVVGSGATVGAALTRDNDVDMVSFTGSVRMARKLMTDAAESNGKRLQLELGGKSANIVFGDITDVVDIAESIFWDAFYAQGHVCSGRTRLLVHGSVRKPLLEKLEAMAAAISPQDPSDASAQFGAIGHRGQFESIIDSIGSAQAAGASLISGGVPVRRESGGYFIPPTIFDSVTPTMRVFQEEIFGPVLTVTEFETDEEALTLANDSRFGLSGTLWTRDFPRIHRFTRAWRTGEVIVRTSAAPFIGPAPCNVSWTPHGVSGYGTDGGIAMLEAFCRRKAIWIQG